MTTADKRTLSPGFILQRALFQLTDRLYRAKSLTEAYEIALDGITELLGCERASILQFDNKGVMRFVGWRGLSEEYRRAVDGHSPWKYGDMDPEPIFVADIDQTNESDELKTVIRKEGIRSLGFVPLMRNQMVAGKFMIYHSGRHDFNDAERDIALLISRQVSFCIERQTADFAASRLKALIQSSSDAIVAKDLNGVQSWNRGAELLFGYTAEEAVGRPITMLIPEDRLAEEVTILGRIRQGQLMEHYETLRLRKDGSLVPVSLTVSPIIDSNGEILGASKIARNITELHREREKQRLLLREMNHRVKNLFAVTASLINLNAREVTSPEARALAASITDRLGALGRAHALTQVDPQGSQSGSSSLPEICRAILKPYEDEGSARISITGDRCEVSNKAITPISLLLHEFATNAAKYGSLSGADGRVEVNCKSQDQAIEIKWSETRGSKVARPETKGFGSRLVEATVSQLGGRIEYDWRESGLEVTVEIPRAHLN